jgi:hypothetical protein
MRKPCAHCLLGSTLSKFWDAHPEYKTSEIIADLLQLTSEFVACAARNNSLEIEGVVKDMQGLIALEIRGAAKNLDMDEAAKLH